MRSVLGLFSLVVVAACGSTPPASPVVVESGAATTPVATAPAKPVADAPSPEVIALQSCDAAALQSLKKQATAGPVTDRATVDAVWTCFDHFRPSQAKSINVVKDVADAVLAVKDASYGPKAAAKIAAPVKDPKDPAESMDQIQFWHAVSIRLLGELRYRPGATALVNVVLDDAKKDLVFWARNALAKIPKDAEPLLIAALAGTNQAGVARAADSLAAISREPGRDAILDALPKVTDDELRAIFALELTRFPTTPQSTTAFLDAYAKVPPKTALSQYGGGNARVMLVGASSGFFDPALGDWAVKEIAAAKGEMADAMAALALPAAIRLMTTANSKAVGAAVNKIKGPAIEKDMYKNALVVLDACKKDVSCYLKELAKPAPTERSQPARMAQVKAAWMAGMYGDASTRAALVDRLTGLKDGGIRQAILEAIDHLSPKGDVAAADELEALFAAERAGTASAPLDEMANLALRLRARAL